MPLLTLTDDAALRDVLRGTLGDAGCEFHPSNLAAAAFEDALGRNPDAILYDLAGRGDRAAFVRAYAARSDRIPLIVVCADGDRDAGLRALKDGAADYVLRPVAMEELAARLSRIQEADHLKRETAALKTALERNAARTALVAESQPMTRLREAISAIAAERLPILFLGERGTGKKTAAEFVHRLDGQRRGSAVIVSCRHVSGLQDSAAWREAQDVGTVILDAIEALPRQDQDALASLLEKAAAPAGNHGRVSLRVVGVSDVRLDSASERKDFSPALYRHFEGRVFVIPPLRDRTADVPALLAHFAQRTAQRIGRPVSVSPRALAMLAAYPWPGNVAELEAAVERAALLGGNGRLEYADFGLVPGLTTPGESTNGALELKPQVEAFERQVLLQALNVTKGNRQSAARLLGISLRTLFYKIKRYGVAN